MEEPFSYQNMLQNFPLTSSTFILCLQEKKTAVREFMAFGFYKGQAWQYRQCKEIPRGCATKVECEVILLNHKENKIRIANEMMKMYCNQKNRKHLLFSTFRSD